VTDAAFTAGVTGPVLITGASGQLARRTAERLLAGAHAGRLILVSRTPQRLAEFASRGADVRFGDFADPASLRSAFAGARRMLLVSATDLERRAAQHREAIRAAAAAGVEHIVYTSGLASGPGNPAAVAPSHHATERALAESGVAWTVLRNSLYAEYQAAEAQRAIEVGRFIHNRGEGRVAYVSREDCARAAAAVLMGSGHEGAVYDITGPQAFDAVALAALYGELGGRIVEPVSVADEAFVSVLLGDGVGDDHLRYGAELVASFGRSIRKGYMASRTDVVETLIGSPPRTLSDVLASLIGRSGDERSE
jgi:NAD(P)H dehydrogenase (quinone)